MGREKGKSINQISANKDTRKRNERKTQTEMKRGPMEGGKQNRKTEAGETEPDLRKLETGQTEGEAANEIEDAVGGRDRETETERLTHGLL